MATNGYVVLLRSLFSLLCTRDSPLGRDVLHTIQVDSRATRPWDATGSLYCIVFCDSFSLSFFYASTLWLTVSTVTRSGKEFSLYATGAPIHCSIDTADILRVRLAQLDEECTSEDDVELEGDDNVEESDDDSGGEATCKDNLDKVCFAAVSLPRLNTFQSLALPATKRRRCSSFDTISDLSSLSDSGMPPSQPGNHRKRSSKQRRRNKRADDQARAGEDSKNVARRRRRAAKPLHLPNVDIAALPVNASSFGGTRQPAVRSSNSAEELVARGYTYIANPNMEARQLVDLVGRV